MEQVDPYVVEQIYVQISKYFFRISIKNATDLFRPNIYIYCLKFDID